MSENNWNQKFTTNESSLAMQCLEDSILKGTLFSERTDVLSLAKANGFTIFNVDVDDAYGSIYIDDENPLPFFNCDMVIGLNAKKNAKEKKEFVAQELCRYFALRYNNAGEKIKLTHRETLVLTNDNFKRMILEPAENAAKETAETIIKCVVNELDAVLSKPTEFMVHRADKDKDDWGDPWGEWGDWDEDTSREEITSPADLESTDSFEKSEAQEAQEWFIAGLLHKYVIMYGDRETQRIESRRIMLWFCMIMAGLLICASLVLIFMWMPTLAGMYSGTEPQTNSVEAADDRTGYFLEGILFSAAAAEEANPDETEIMDPNDTITPVDVKTQVKQALDEYFEGDAFGSDLGASLGNLDLSAIPTDDTSQPVKDIVAVISICITILGSIFGLLRMIAKYVLPVKEEERMHTFVDSLQRDSFKRGMVYMLGYEKKFNDILSYLKVTSAEEAKIKKTQMELESKKIRNRVKALFGTGPLIKTNTQIAEDTQGVTDDGGE